MLKAFTDNKLTDIYSHFPLAVAGALVYIDNISFAYAHSIINNGDTVSSVLQIIHSASADAKRSKVLKKYHKILVQDPLGPGLSTSQKADFVATMMRSTTNLVTPSGLRMKFDLIGNSATWLFLGEVQKPIANLQRSQLKETDEEAAADQWKMWLKEGKNAGKTELHVLIDVFEDFNGGDFGGAFSVMKMNFLKVYRACAEHGQTFEKLMLEKFGRGHQSF
jgi:hypothetical protein